MTKPLTMMLDAGTATQTGLGRRMERPRITASGLRTAGGPAKILEFAVASAAKKPRSRESWSRRAGVSEAERLAAVAFGALITPAVWAGHSLLVWMHLL